jgi:hypothetical protein
MAWVKLKYWLLIIAAMPLVAAAAAPPQCDVGPVTKVFGAVPWLVYSCNDATSLVLMSAPGSPASPFYFTFSLEGGSYRLRGEGTGSKTATDAALKDLEALSASDIQALRRETIAAAVNKP